jgi:hypothetical protein
MLTILADIVSILAENSSFKFPQEAGEIPGLASGPPTAWVLPAD